MNLTVYMIGAAGAVAIAAVGWASWQSHLLRAEQAENAKLERSVMALSAEREQAELARQVARAEAARFRGQAEEYARLRESLLQGDNDAPLPDWFAAYLERLLGPAGDSIPGTPH